MFYGVGVTPLNFVVRKSPGRRKIIMSKSKKRNGAIKPNKEICAIDSSTGEIKKRGTESESVEERKAPLGEELLAHHLIFTAPDRQILNRPNAALEFQLSSYMLYRGLDPKSTCAAMRGTLAIAVMNASLTCIADGSRQGVPSQYRDSNLRLGFKGAAVADNLLRGLSDSSAEPQKGVNVGQVKIEAGGQAIVGNFESGQRGRNQPSDEMVPPRPGKTERRP
jgi:hypothetical protein